MNLRRLLHVPPAGAVIRMLGPAFVVSIGYIDPGNWATDLAAGAYAYTLLWVVVLANIIALILQLAVARITLETRKDLATLIAARWPKFSPLFWVVFQGAAIATDLAEFTGIVLGIELLFHTSAVISVAAGLAIVGFLLTFTDKSAKGLEYGLMTLLGIVSIGIVAQVPRLHPDWPAVAAGALVPHIPNGAALLIVVGIIGATVMPHNLFLHASLIKRNVVDWDGANHAHRRRFFTTETIIALNIAMFINGSILIIGAALGGAEGSIAQAFARISAPNSWPAAAFGAALIFAGIAASVTATIAGDYIFRAFSPIVVRPVIRRSITLLPAAIAIIAGASLADLLVWSQVTLALVLPVVLIPLAQIAYSVRPRHGRFGGQVFAGTVTAAALVCTGFDGIMLAQLGGVF